MVLSQEACALPAKPKLQQLRPCSVLDEGEEPSLRCPDGPTTRKGRFDNGDMTSQAIRFGLDLEKVS